MFPNRFFPGNFKSFTCHPYWVRMLASKASNSLYRFHTDQELVVTAFAPTNPFVFDRTQLVTSYSAWRFPPALLMRTLEGNAMNGKGMR